MKNMDMYVWVAGKNYISDDDEELLKREMGTDSLDEAIEKAGRMAKRHLRNEVFSEMDEFHLLEVEYELQEE